MTVSKVLFSSEKQDWGTPPCLYEELNRQYGPFKLDAATRESNPLKTKKFYTIEDNALSKSWLNPTYVNPPYGRGVGVWIEKAYAESVRGNRVVMLIPARTDTKWFHKYIYLRPRVQVNFLKGRLSMWNYDINQPHPHKAPFPSMVVIFYP